MIARPGGQCDRHYEIEAGIGEIRGIVAGTDAKVDALSARLDRLMLHLVPAGRNGSGSVTVQNTASSSAPTTPPSGDSVPWQRLLLLLATIAIMLATLASGSLSRRIEPPPEQIEAKRVPGP